MPLMNLAHQSEHQMSTSELMLINCCSERCQQRDEGSPAMPPRGKRGPARRLGAVSDRAAWRQCRGGKGSVGHVGNSLSEATSRRRFPQISKLDTPANY